MTKAAVGVPCVFSATKVRPSRITASVVLLAATIGSQPITRSASAVPTLVVVDRLRAVGDLDVAPGRAALLRQAGRVLRDDALAFEVRGHAEQLADRDHAGAADAGDDDAPRPLVPAQRQRRLGAAIAGSANGSGRALGVFVRS